MSPIDGVPVAIKDNLAVTGMPATWGSRVFAASIVAADELPIARLRAADAVFVGKTNTPEFAVEGYTGNSLFGVTGNAWDPTLPPGGSSGGSVTAVAARMLPIAIGTDGGGSIRRPVAYSGLVGLKPGIGSVPRYGGLPQVLLDFEVVGPVAQTVADVADVFVVLRGPDRHDPSSRQATGADAALRYSPAPLRILYVERFVDAPCDPQIAASARDIADLLADLGHVVEDGPLPLDLGRLNNLWPTIAAIGLGRMIGKVSTMREHAGAQYLDMARSGADLGAVHLAEILGEVRRLRSEAFMLFNTVDVIITPCCAAPPWKAAVTHPTEIDGKPVGPRGHAVYTGCANAIGHPAVAVPANPGADGMAIGVQLVGDLFSEQSLLALA